MEKRISVKNELSTKMIMRGTNTCSILDLSNNTFLGLISNQQLWVRYKTNVVSLRQYYYQKLLRILSGKARKNERSHEEIDVQNELATDRNKSTVQNLFASWNRSKHERLNKITLRTMEEKNYLLSRNFRILSTVFGGIVDGCSQRRPSFLQRTRAVKGRIVVFKVCHVMFQTLSYILIADPRLSGTNFRI